MMSEFLIEIGCEEIPARFLPAASQRLKQKFTEILTAKSLSFDDIEAYSTPRRLIVRVTGLAATQPAQSQVIMGPPYSAAFDEDRYPTKAALGFARKNQVAVEALSRVETEKGSYLVYQKQIPGRGARQILEEETPTAIRALELPKSMRWESSRFPFLRPIRWILCLLDGQVLPIKMASVQAANRTFGHRILAGNKEEQVLNFVEYRQRLRASQVEIDPKDRRRQIERDLHIAAMGQRGSLIEDKSLLQTVTHLSEHPSVVCGDFDPVFLKLPREVLITVMREHQKYFSLHDSEGQLLPKFLAVVDSDRTYANQIQAGHERVLRARLADAAFFWEADLKVSLKNRVSLLKQITYQVKLGNLFDKTQRIICLAKFLSATLERSELLPLVEQAAKLCKADLTTEMVREFSNLQGVMGGLYARVQGLDVGVAEAVYDHYLPTTSEDQVPRELIGSIVSIADKLDTLTGAFCMGLIPTGSRDPLALRRQALGLIRILLVKELGFSLERTLRKGAYAGLKKFADRSLEQTLHALENFLKDRLRFIFKEQGFRYDEINAVVEVCWDNPLECRKRLDAIARMRESSDFQSLANSFKRIKNILLKAAVDPRTESAIDPTLFQASEEKSLHRAVVLMNPRISSALRAGRHEAALGLMASLRPSVDLFFDKVLVMDENQTLRRNRLALLVLLLQTFLEVADISEMMTA